MQMPKFSVVIPVYNHFDLLHNRINELRIHAQDTEIIVVDDASPELDIRGGVAFWQSVPGMTVRYYKNKENLGFPGTCNVGIRLAKGEIIALLSSDVEIKADFLTETEKVLENNHCIVGGRLVDWNSGWNIFSFGGPVAYLEGYYLAAYKDTWHKAKGLDENFAPFDAEDIDLGIWAVYKGYNLIPINQTGKFFIHNNGTTIGSLGIDREAITRRNLKYLDEKWSKILNGRRYESLKEDLCQQK